jgi:hypothetical protein
VSAPDRPIATKEADALGRWPLAKTIFELIRAAPGDQPVRIGIYGGWGEGKTSVMRLVEALAAPAGMAVCWFPAWIVGTSADLWPAFVDALQTTTRQPDWRVRGKQAAAKLLSNSAEVAQSNSYTKTAHALFRLAHPLTAINKKDAERLMDRIAAGKRIIVMIDDLDRADAAVIPKLLMGLHDLFDQIGQCAFVVALDPTAVSSGLGQLNPAWGSAPAFLEKIIQYPFWLHDATRDQVRELGLAAIARHTPALPAQAALDVLDLLPRNPRKLKQFFRSLERLGPTINRHEPEELNAVLILLIELVRNAAPEVADVLFSDKEFLRDFAGAPVVKSLTSKSDGDSTMLSRIEAIVNDRLVGMEPRERSAVTRELDRIVAAAVDTSFVLLPADLERHVELEQAPPILTKKEFKKIATEAGDLRAAHRLQSLLIAHAEYIDRSEAEVQAGFVRVLLESRDEFLQEAEDTVQDDTAADLRLKADRLLSLLDTLVADLGVFRNPAIKDRVQLFLAFRNHHTQWLNRASHAALAPMRQRERQLLFRAAEDIRDRSADVLAALKPWDVHRTRVFDEIAGAEKIKAVQEALVQLFGAALVETTLQRFERRGGVEALYGLTPEKEPELWLLLATDSPFHKSEYRAKLREIAIGTGESVAENFFAYLRIILGEEGTGFVASSLGDDVELIEMAWEAARRLRPQQRVRDTLVQVGETLRQRLAGKASIPLPAWTSDDPKLRAALGTDDEPSDMRRATSASVEEQANVDAEASRASRAVDD